MISLYILQFIIYKERIFHFSDHFNDCVYIINISMKNHLNFRFIIYSFIINLFINIIYNQFIYKYHLLKYLFN